MPIYEYQCESCGHSFERLVFNKEGEPDVCPKCHHKKVKKLVSTTSFMSTPSIGTCSTGGSKGFS